MTREQIREVEASVDPVGVAIEEQLDKNGWTFARFREELDEALRERDQRRPRRIKAV